ncbi:MAG TPA: STAS domain-containing protein [Hyphomicrobiaceae bacterium]|nr:STAS domain-containing protein [Hyphomicrobiaceae bacterium]
MRFVFKAPQRFDADGVTANRTVIERLANSNGDVIVDMAEVELIDGSGFGALAHIHKRLARQKHSVTVVNVGGQPRDLMLRTGLLDVLGSRASAETLMTGDYVIVAAQGQAAEGIATDRRTAA